MYQDPANHNRLRQGDVLEEFYFPRYSFGTLKLLHEISDDGGVQFSERAQVTARTGPGVVISQCCEFTSTKRNAFSLAVMKPVRELFRPGLEVWGFNVAELKPVARSTYRGGRRLTDEQLEMLRAANAVDPEADENDAVNVYLYEPDGEFLTEPYLVDFTRVVSVRMQDQERVLSSKVLQLDAEHRREFQVKLAYYYGRKAE